MRLVKRAEYELVYGSGQRRSSPQFAVFFREQAAHQTGAGRASRFGISVKKTLGGAVVRNRIRRRIREILRRHKSEIPPGWDIVIHPRRSVAKAPFAPLEAELVRLLQGIATTAAPARRSLGEGGKP